MPDHHSSALVQPSSVKNLTSNTLSTATIKSEVTISQNMYAGHSTEPWVEITEQPMTKGQRFRYKCEGRSAGSLPGQNSTVEKKTFPTIYIHNFNGNAAIVVVSCVTKDLPYRPHPHNLVGQDCKDGVCTLRVKGPGPIVFSNIGIQCCKKHDIGESLQTRAKIRVDPFATGTQSDLNSIDLNAVRLCFQVFLPDSNKKFTRVVKPIVSHPIIDKKTVHDLVICRLSRQSGYAQGGDEVFLLCEKVIKDDIQVRFYQETEDGVCWEAYGEFTAQDIHHQYAIVFKTPAYRELNIQTTVQVFIQLRRPSDEEVGDPKPFQYIPNETDPYGIVGKRKRSSSSALSNIPTPVFVDVKDDVDNKESAFTSSIKLRLKKKAEQSLQKKERVPRAKTEVSLPEYSFVNIGGSQLAPALTYAASMQSMSGTGGNDMAEESNTIVGRDGPVTFLSMLGVNDEQIQQLTFTPINAASGQLIDGNYIQYIHYSGDNSSQVSTAPLLISDFVEVDESRTFNVKTTDGTVLAEESVMKDNSAKTSNDV